MSGTIGLGNIACKEAFPLVPKVSAALWERSQAERRVMLVATNRKYGNGRCFNTESRIRIGRRKISIRISVGVRAW